MKTLLILLSACAFAAPGDAVREAEKRWASAVVARDFAALDAIFSDDLIYAHSSGVIETKAEYTGKLRDGRQKYTGIHHGKLTVKLHGNAAVAHSMVHMTGTNPQGPFDDHLMMLHLWVQEGGRWRLAAHQTTKLH